MKRYVGQRVRIRWSDTRTDLVGSEARITEVRLMKNHVGTGLDWEGYGLEVSPIEWSGGVWRAWSEDQLEPILDQHQSCDEDFKRDLDRMLERVTERVR